MSLKAFLRQNAIKPENVKVAISDRFLGEDGKPELWELRPISESHHLKIKDSCMRRSSRKRGAPDLDSSLYNLRLMAASVVYPDLKDAELQASYGVVGGEELLKTMLLPGETLDLLLKVQEVNGFDRDLTEEAKEEVKNS